MIPSVEVLVIDETVLLIPIPSYTATTLIVQLLPGARDKNVLNKPLSTVTDPLFIVDVVSHNS